MGLSSLLFVGDSGSFKLDETFCFAHIQMHGHVETGLSLLVRVKEN